MSKESFKNYIRSIVLEEIKLLEKLRGGFDLNHFKTLKAPEEMIKYANQTLGKPLGKGSSRLVFPLSSGKVLKITRTGTDLGEEPGRAQNQAEVDVWTNPKTKPVVAKVFDYDPNFNWIISEITRPFKPSIYPEQAIGLDTETFELLLQYALKNKNPSFDQAYNSIIGIELNELEDIRKESEALKAEQQHLSGTNISPAKQKQLRDREMGLAYRQMDAEKALNKFKTMNVAKIKPLINGLIAMRDQMGLYIYDLLRMDHYGITGDGRIVVIDYGFNKDIGEKYYGWEEPSSAAKTNAI